MLRISLENLIVTMLKVTVLNQSSVHRWFRRWQILEMKWFTANGKEAEAKITIKYHKASFPSKNKSSVGKISKLILDKINNNSQKETSAIKWKDLSSVIEWFVNIREMKRSSFVVFDLKRFDLLITERLFTKTAIQLAK